VPVLVNSCHTLHCCPCPCTQTHPLLDCSTSAHGLCCSSEREVPPERSCLVGVPFTRGRFPLFLPGCHHPHRYGAALRRASSWDCCPVGTPALCVVTGPTSRKAVLFSVQTRVSCRTRRKACASSSLSTASRALRSGAFGCLHGTGPGELVPQPLCLPGAFCCRTRWSVRLRFA
jgi:hypothetical protein